MASEPEDYVQSDPDATLERAFITEYLQRHGQTISTIHELPPDRAALLMKEASIYASAKLSEMESRAHYVHDLHDAAKGTS